jgi:hypothetical protein
VSRGRVGDLALEPGELGLGGGPGDRDVRDGIGEAAAVRRCVGEGRDEPADQPADHVAGLRVEEEVAGEPAEEPQRDPERRRAGHGVGQRGQIGRAERCPAPREQQGDVPRQTTPRHPDRRQPPAVDQARQVGQAHADGRAVPDRER